MAPTRNYTKTIIQLNINKTATCEGSLINKGNFEYGEPW